MVGGANVIPGDVLSECLGAKICLRFYKMITNFLQLSGEVNEGFVRGSRRGCQETRHG